jgi:transcriptional regulator with XRE-family HTH domain
MAEFAGWASRGKRDGAEEMRVADLLRRFRREQSLTQEVLAAKLGVDVGTLARWESGKQRPRASTEAQIRNLIRPQSGVDYTLRAIIETTPYAMQLLRFDTLNLAVSQSLAALGGRSPADLIGTLDIHDMHPEHIAAHEPFGGVEETLRNVKLAQGIDVWGTDAPTNLSGACIPLAFVTQGVSLDDGTHAVLVTLEPARSGSTGGLSEPLKPGLQSIVFR